MYFCCLALKKHYQAGSVLNSDLWKQKIKASQYWSLVYTTVYTVHAGALETITIDGVYGSFTTNSDGTVNHALPLGELTLHGSVSEQSFERTVTNDTTEVYVMPTGSLYWYGNTGSWSTYAYGKTSSYTKKLPSITKNTNSITFTFSADGSGGYEGIYALTSKVNLQKYSKLKINILSIKPTSASNTFISLAVINNLANGFTVLDEYYINKAGEPSIGISEVDISDISEGYICLRGMAGQSLITNTIYNKIWLE